MFSLVRAGATMGCLSNHVTVFISIAVTCEYIKANHGIEVCWGNFKTKMDENKYLRQENFSTAMQWTVDASKLVLESKCDGENLKTKMDENQY